MAKKNRRKPKAVNANPPTASGDQPPRDLRGANPKPPSGGWGPAWAIAIAAWLLYVPTIDHSFTLDDTHVVLKNAAVGQSQWLEAATTPYWPGQTASNWRPLATSSWLVDRALLGTASQLSGEEQQQAWAARHHLVNCVLYGFVVLASFPVARRILGSAPAAWVGCLLFAVHPAHCEVVAPIVGRADLIAALGSLVMLSAFWRYRDGDGAKWLVLSVAAFVLGLGGKEFVLAIVPLMLLADRWLFDKPWTTRSGREILAYLPFGLAAVVYLAARWWVLGEHSFVHGHAESLSWLERLAFAGRNTWESFGLLIAPWRFHHAITTLPSDSAFTYPLPTGLMMAVWPILAAPLWTGWIVLERRFPVAAFCWLGMLLPWLPTSGLLPTGAGVSLRFLFLPTLFLACGAVAFGRWCIRRWPKVQSSAWGLAGAAVVAGILIASWRMPAWKNDGAYHQAVLAEEPACYTSNYSYGTWLAMDGDMPRARKWFRKAAEIAGSEDPTYMARLNLAISYEYDSAGRRYGAGADLERALGLYDEILANDPSLLAAHLNAGAVCGHLSDRHVGEPNQRLAFIRQGLSHYEEALRIDPSHVDASLWHRYAGRMANELRLFDKVRQHFLADAETLVARSDELRGTLGEQTWTARKSDAISGLLYSLETNPSSEEAAAIVAELKTLRSR